MSQPARLANGWRAHEESHLQRLQFIVHHAPELGFPINGVRRLLRVAKQGGAACSEMRALTETHLANVQPRLAELTNAMKPGAM
jgi:DNA-binding transcriptional MerR regulator